MYMYMYPIASYRRYRIFQAGCVHMLSGLHDRSTVLHIMMWLWCPSGGCTYTVHVQCACL